MIYSSEPHVFDICGSLCQDYLDSRKLVTRNRRKPMISTKIYNHIVMRIRDEKRAEHVEIAESRHVFPGIQVVAWLFAMRVYKRQI